jgi:Mrp family chromosome partitioning ATPase
MSDCNHNCEECAKKKSGECQSSHDFRAPQNKKSNVKKVIAVMSGKGGVGKSLVTELLAVASAKIGLKTAILDADITGPSIPTAFGVKERAVSDTENVLPCRSQTGIALMSLNLLVDNPSDPVVWRGPVIAGAVKQFWSDVAWGETDVMFVDMPPGTGDVPLTVFQSLPIAGVVVVTSPQDLVSMIVEKAVNMAKLMDVKVLGLVENYSYIVCPDCGKVIRPYGESKIESLAQSYGTKVLAKLPIDPELASLCDKGVIELFEGDYLDRAADEIEAATK